MLTLLVDREAALNAQDNSRIAPLHSLTSRGNVNGVHLLLARGANVSIQAPNRNTPLHFAALGRWAETSGLLVESKADIESRDEQGRTPLVVAAREMAGPDVVRRLLDLGASIDASDQFGGTALSLADWRGSADIVGLLLEQGGVEKATVRFAGMRGEEAHTTFVDEAEMSFLGNRFLRQERLPEAVAVLEMNSQAFSESWNAWDSLAKPAPKAVDATGPSHSIPGPWGSTLTTRTARTT